MRLVQLQSRPPAQSPAGPLRAPQGLSMASRLSTIASDLSEELEHRPPAQLRRVASVAALLAVDRTELVDPRLAPALSALRDGAPVSSSERSAASQVTDELDERAWSIQEKVDAGELPKQAYLDAFQRARAAASVSFALDPDPVEAAREAVYEAQAAVADLDAIRAAVSRAIGS